uniref:F-box domain-containing protein n=1 Tax=Gibberella zeae TaxID=5518 RepID=A0A4E9EH26_GIBZA
MLRVNKLISNATTAWLYGTHELLFKFPTNDLPLFISKVRESTLHSIRRVKLQHSWGQNLELGLRLLPCCKNLDSLKLSSITKLQEYHLPVLAQMRLKNFEYDGLPVREMEKIRNIIRGGTKPKGRLLNLSREQILEYYGVELYVE